MRLSAFFSGLVLDSVSTTLLIIRSSAGYPEDSIVDLP